MSNLHFIWFVGNFGFNLGLLYSIRNATINTTETLPLFMNITGRYFKNTNFYIISQEMEPIECFSLFIKNIPGTVEIHNEDNFVGKFGFFLFFPQNTTKSYKNILEKLTSFTYNRFLIFWPNDPDESKIHSFVFQFWKFKLLNIAILKKNPDKSFDIYTYDPYTESNCNRPGPLDLLDTWNSTHSYFRFNRDLFPLTKKLKNLHGCELVCFAKTRPPDAIVKEIGNNTWELDGIGGQLMEEVRKRINFTPIIKVPKLNVSVDKYGYDISYGYPELVTELLNNFTVDLGFGIYSHIIYDNPRVEFAMTTVCECYGWAVPAHSGRIIPVWMYYTNEFNFLVWFLILVVFTSGVLLFYSMIKIYFVSSPVLHTIDYAFLYVISLHLGISASPKIKFLKIRLWISAIILYSLIISSAYQSSLGSFLTVPWQRENIKSFQEILSANYNLIGIPQGKRILQRFSADNYVLKTLSNYFQVHREHFDSVVLRIQRQKDTATFGAQRFVQFYISNELNGTNRDDVYLLPKCVIQAHSSPFLYKKGSPFIKPIDKIISAAVESGLTNFWFKYSTPKIGRSLAQIFPLSLQQLKLAFAILLVGNCLAIFTFVWELKKPRVESQVGIPTRKITTSIK